MPTPWSKAWLVPGIVAGACMVLSTWAHAVLGWAAMRGALEKTGAGDSLTHGLQAGWQFGSMAMLVFGAILLATAAEVARGGIASRFPVLAIGVGYIGFGIYGLALREGRPLFLFFLGLGLLASLFAWALPSAMKQTPN